MNRSRRTFVRRQRNLGNGRGDARRARRNLMGLERLEERTLLAGNLNLWHNVLQPADVNGDTRVSAVDVLSVINAINLSGPRRLGDLLGSAAAGEGGEGPDRPAAMVDVNNDQYLAPVDVLLVVNHINGAGEGTLARVQALAKNYVLPVGTTPATRTDVMVATPGTKFLIEIRGQDNKTATGMPEAYGDDYYGMAEVATSLGFDANAFTIPTGASIDPSSDWNGGFPISFRNPDDYQEFYAVGDPNPSVVTKRWNFFGSVLPFAETRVVGDQGTVEAWAFTDTNTPPYGRVLEGVPQDKRDIFLNLHAYEVPFVVQSMAASDDTQFVSEGAAVTFAVHTNDVLNQGDYAFSVGPLYFGGTPLPDGNDPDDLPDNYEPSMTWGNNPPRADGILLPEQVEWTGDIVNVPLGGRVLKVDHVDAAHASYVTINPANNMVTYNAAGRSPGTDVFTYYLSDGQGGTASANVTVTIGAFNDPPVLTVASPINVDEKTAQVPVTASVTDPDVGSGTMTLTATVTSGTITLGDATKLAYTSGSGTNTTAFTANGTMLDINTALAGTKFFPESALYNGTAKIVLNINDNGHTGDDGHKQDTKTITINVAAVNDVPVQTVPGDQTVPNNSPGFAFPASSFSVSDPDAPLGNEFSAWTSLTLELPPGVAGSPGTLVVPGFTGSGTFTDPLMMNDTPNAITAALQSVTYHPPTGVPLSYTADVTLTMTTNDSNYFGKPGPTMRSDSLTIHLVPPAYPYAIDDRFTIDEDTGAHAFDVLDNDLARGTLTIDDAGGATHGTVTFTGTDVTYTPDDDYFGSDEFTYTISDTHKPYDPEANLTATVSVIVSPVNDGPTLDIGGTATIPTERSTNEDNDLPFGPGTTFTVGDIDAGSTNVQVTATVGQCYLTVGAPSGATIGGDGTDVVIITGQIAQVNGALNSLIYTPTLNFSGTDYLKLLVDDLGHTGGGSRTAAGTVTITIDPVNDAPTMKAPANEATLENTPLFLPAGGVHEISVNDVDNASLTVDLVANNGTLTLASTLNLTTVTGNTTASVHMVGPLVALNAALNNLRFDPTQSFEGDATIVATAQDGEPLSVSKTISIVVSGVNDAPVIASPGNQTVNEDEDLTFNGNLRVTDVDGGAFTERVTLQVTSGKITVNTPGDVTIVGSGTSSVTLDGPLGLADGSGGGINAALKGATYRALQDFNTPDTGISPVMTVTVNDNGHTGTGGHQGDSEAFTITVNEVNDAPTAVDDYSQTNRLLILQNSTNNAIAVLTNDYFDPPDKGESLSISNVNTANAHGTVTVQGNQLLYTPTTGYLGNAEIVYTILDRATGGLTDTATVYVQVVDFVPSNVSGYVMIDLDGDGIKDANELGIAGVQVTLTGTNIQGNPVNLTTTTDATGKYQFTAVLPTLAGTKYTIAETQPGAFVDGPEHVGDQGGTSTVNDKIDIFLPLFGYPAGITGSQNNFTELGLTQAYASLGLWDLLHSGTPGQTGAQGLIFGTGANGNVQWYVNVGGWDGMAPTLVSAGQLTVNNTATSTASQVTLNPNLVQEATGPSGTGYRCFGGYSSFLSQGGGGLTGGEGEAAGDLDAYQRAVDTLFGLTGGAL